MTGRDADARGRAAPDDDAPDPDAAADRRAVEGRDSKAEVAAKERGERVYEETYGRAAGERYGAADYPHAYGAPGRTDWRRALRAYVNGHDRGWEADRKYEVAAGEEPARREPRSPASAGGRGGEGDAGAAGASEADDATARTGRGTRFGVGVADPSEMTFHRSASTWRERLPRAPRMPRHAGRDLSARRGRGEQA
jgi:hypothetical protein